MPFRLRLLIVVLAVAATACTGSDGAGATTAGTFPQPSPPPQITDAATVHHVAVDGSDAADGTAQDPWATIATSLTRLDPGDTLVVHGGTYRERIRNPRTTPATAEEPILVTAAPGERPVIQGLLWLKDIDHWTLDGIDVTWDAGTGTSGEHMVKVTDGTGWAMRNSEIWGARSFAGVLVATSGGPEPRGWEITGSCVHDTVPSNGTNQDHLIYVNSGLESGPGLIAGNLLFGAPNGNGVKLGGPSATSGGAANVTLRHNTIHATAQNVLIAYGAHDNLVEANLLSEVGAGYGNIRGYQLDGVDNVARANAGGGAESLLRNDDGHVGVADGGGNLFPVDPAFDRTDGCSGFVPTNEEAAAFGHLAAPVDAAGDRIEPVGSFARIAGPDRVGTAVAIARYGWERSDRAVIARADDPADALAGAPLAAALDAPLLLTPRDGLAAAVGSVLSELGVSRVVVLGGETAVPAPVVADLRSLGLSVDRVAGASREATAVRVAERLGSSGRAMLVRGRSDGADDRAWPDALAVSGAAARAAATGQPVPILLVGDAVGADTLTALSELDVREVVLVGGTSVLPDVIAETLSVAGYAVDRWAGADRYATSREVNDRAGASGPLVVATGQAFPDGLAAGALNARVGGTLLLSPRAGDPANVEWIEAHAAELGDVLLVGGDAALSHEAGAAYGLAADSS